VVLPIGDAPNPRGVPAVTYLLIAANVAVYLLVSLPLGAQPPAANDPALAAYLRAISHVVGDRVPLAVLARQTTAYDVFLFTHGFRPAAPSLRGVFEAMFLHAGLLHLAGNMLFLWIYGDNVERRLGPVRYLATYLGTGAAATVAHWASAPHSMLPVVGASGAISGILGCYFLWFPRNVVRLLWLFPPFIGRVFEVPARLVLGLYVVADNLLPYLMERGEGGVAHGAHIGGFIAGVAVAWLADRAGVGATGDDYGSTASSTDADEPGALVDAGRFADAAAAYLRLPARATRGALAPPQALALAQWLRRAGHADAALVVLRRIVRDARDERMLARAHLALGTILLEDLDQPTPAYQHFLAVLDLDADPESVAAARAALATIAGRQKRSLGWGQPS
jgi:membrane associated rhomboid family serine protease